MKMMRLIFILSFTLQCRSLSLEIIPTDSMNDEIEKYVELNMDEGENSSSVEELGLTTLIYETKPDANPPTSTPSILTLQEFSRDFEKEITETPYAFMAEPSETAQDPPEMNIKRNKSIKARLLDSKSSEMLIGSEHLNESVEIVLEDTTVVATNADSDGNETIFYNEGDDATTVQPTTPKKPKNLEIYKTRPNVLLRHYVEDSRLRSPIAALIDKKANPLIKSKKLWKSALRPNSLLDIMVVSYDSEGDKNFSRKSSKLI